MKSFFWKFVICLVPCVLAAWVSVLAISRYMRGEPGAVKIGPDLAGGTTLVYEIDLARTRGSDAKDKDKDKEKDKEEGRFDPVRDINVLAEALKRRIDPNDLYNIVIRPAGGEGRVEIVLPTGGTFQARKAQEAWDDLLDKIKSKYFSGRDDVKLDVARGKIFELADEIQIKLSTEKWENRLFRNEPGSKDNLGDKAWERLKNNAIEYWAALEPYRTQLNKLDASKERLKDLNRFVYQKLADHPEEATTEKVIDTWIKKQAWEELMVRIRDRWKDLGLDAYKEEMKQIQPDSFEQLIGFIRSRGVLMAQAGLAALEPLVGNDVSLGDETPSREDIDKFTEENYGPSAASIVKEIDKLREKEGRSRDLSTEEVQRIKDLVAKVGALEFRILANMEDDKEGIKAAKAILNSENPAIQEKLKKAQESGLPPPAPDEQFTINLPQGNKSIVRYEWVELGPQERKSLRLNNASKNDPDPFRSHAWKEAFFKSKSEKAFQITDRPGGTRTILQGALFFRRESKNRNLPEEERRNKEVEYFVLTRTPEYDPADPTKQTPKIGGEYLTNAAASMGDGITPSVSFAFNNEGSRLFGTITRKNVPSGSGGEDSQIKRHLAIILDDMVMSAPSINSVITSSGQITGDFTRKEVDGLVNILRAGRLPATLKPQPVSETTMGPTLGEDTVRSGVLAVGLALLAVMVFMIFYYRFAGLVASIALLANLLLTVGFMVFVQATFTLPGLAGLVLMLGMAVDANVLIYERLREERERGASLPLALRNGYERALPTIIDTHLSSIFTAIVLYVVGNDQLKGFGVSLTVGLLISLFTSLYMTRVIFDYWQYRGWLTKLSMLRLFARPNIDFMRIRVPMFVATIVVSIVGLVLFIGRLPDNLNIDFTGGTAYSGRLIQHVSTRDLRDFFDATNQERFLELVSVKEFPDSNGTHFTVQFKGEKEPRDLFLANPPKGETPTERETSTDPGSLRHRLARLPDVSVEQSFPSMEHYSKPNESPFFTVRTSEKETEIVQTILDRVMRSKDGTALLKTIYLRTDPLTGRETRLRFFSEREGTKPESASPSFVKSLFQRELMRNFGVKDKREMPITYEISGEGRATDDGRYEVLRLRFDAELKDDQKKKVQTALDATVRNFERRPQPDRLENFDSQLANETRLRAMWAILASWAAILLYLWFRFGNWTFGLAAVVCLVHDLFLTLGLIAACHWFAGTFLGDMLLLDDFKIDLGAIAALLTLVGYSVNDTIVVFDRIREVRGKNPDLNAKMINDSINQTLSRTVLASLTTWLVVFVFFVWGGPGVHLFAFVMVVGVLVGTYSSIYIASPLLLMLGEGLKETPAHLKVARPQPESGPA